MVANEIISGKKKKEAINENPEIGSIHEGNSGSSSAKEILKALSEEISSIVNELLDALYDPKYADKFAGAILFLYDKFKGKGLSQTAIEKLLYEYSKNVDKLILLLKKEEK